MIQKKIKGEEKRGEKRRGEEKKGEEKREKKEGKGREEETVGVEWVTGGDQWAYKGSLRSKTKQAIEVITTECEAIGWPIVGGWIVAPKRYAHILLPGTCKSNLIWEKGLCRCNWIKDLKMISSWVVQEDPKSNEWQVSYKRQKERHTRGEGICK